MSKLHGFQRIEKDEIETIYITHLPTHIKPVLLIGKGNVFQKVASFNNEKCAEVFCKMLDKWLGTGGME